MKKAFFLSLILLAVIATGCIQKQTAHEETVQPQRNNLNQEFPNRQAFDGERFDEASKGDLTVGTKISAMGEEGSDGALIADRIIIGAFNVEFFGPPAGQIGDGEAAKPPGDQPQFGNGDFNPEQFQNMTEEERQQFFAERQRPGGFGAGGGGFTTRAGARATGEILSIDDLSITIKLDEGGSTDPR